MPDDQHGTSRESAHAVNKLQWHQSLHFKLAALFVVLILILGGSAVLVSKLLVRDGLVAETFRYERESGYRLALQFDGAAERAQTLAATLARLAATGLRPSAAQLAELLPGADLIDSVGIWPEQDRSSQFWQRDAGGALQAREDYNDPRTIGYTHEKWYTPARYMPKNRCYWTPAYRDALSRREVITCSMPIPATQGNAGVVTVSLSIDALQSAFARATGNDIGYSLLLDDDNRLLALSAVAAKIGGATRPRNLAELGQLQPSFNPVALALHQQEDAAVAATAKASSNSAAQAAALSAGTRDMSRAEAAAALAQIAAAGAANAEPQQLRIDDDPVLGDDAFATVFTLPGGRWHLIRVTPMKKGFAGANHIFNLTLLINASAVVLTLLLVFAGLRRLVVRPLRDMVARLANSGSVEDSLHVSLDDRPRNEIGAVAFWHNERVRQMHELMERAIATNAQLVMESEERRNAQEALSRVQERAALALQSVADGVITADVQGRVEDMNPVAEQLTGLSLRAARGKAFNEVFTARGKGDVVMPNLALMVVQRGARLDYAEGMRLISLAGDTYEVQLTVTPIRTRQNRVIGAVVVFRRNNEQPQSSQPLQTPTPTTIADRYAVDQTTGLPMRVAFDRRLRGLLDATRGLRSHALLFVDIDQLQHINDDGGLQAGDEAIVRVGDVLSAMKSKTGEVFRLSGDHYAVLVENLDGEQARALAETLRTAIEATPLEWESRRHIITVSIGIKVFDSREINPAQLIQHAMTACGAAKRAGRNRIQLWNEGLDESPERIDDSVWVRRIRAGLDKNLFHLTTQLIQPSSQHQAEGHAFEVLVTLEDEEGFWSTASAFVPVAERNQLMPELDRWVISRTIEHLAQNPEQASKISFITINLAASSLANHSVLEHIVQLLEKMPAVPAHRICFEISEETATSHLQQAMVFCESMRGIGCRLSVDHFSGRRISDVNLLRRLPLNYVKVDSRQFRNIVSDAVEQMMAESLVRLARTLQKRLIVANLEDSARLEAWKRLGADYFQGHVIAKPTPVIFLAPP